MTEYLAGIGIKSTPISGDLTTLHHNTPPIEKSLHYLIRQHMQLFRGQMGCCSKGTNGDAKSAGSKDEFVKMSQSIASGTPLRPIPRMDQEDRRAKGGTAVEARRV